MAWLAVKGGGWKGELAANTTALSAHPSVHECVWMCMSVCSCPCWQPGSGHFDGHTYKRQSHDAVTVTHEGWCRACKPNAFLFHLWHAASGLHAMRRLSYHIVPYRIISYRNSRMVSVVLSSFLACRAVVDSTRLDSTLSLSLCRSGWIFIHMHAQRERERWIVGVECREGGTGQTTDAHFARRRRGDVALVDARTQGGSKCHASSLGVSHCAVHTRGRGEEGEPVGSAVPCLRIVCVPVVCAACVLFCRQRSIRAIRSTTSCPFHR